MQAKSASLSLAERALMPFMPPNAFLAFRRAPKDASPSGCGSMKKSGRSQRWAHRLACQHPSRKAEAYGDCLQVSHRHFVPPLVVPPIRRHSRSTEGDRGRRLSKVRWRRGFASHPQNPRLASVGKRRAALLQFRVHLRQIVRSDSSSEMLPTPLSPCAGPDCLLIIR
jgi:hypothetical protein